jgi:hypothetical protein
MHPTRPRFVAFTPDTLPRQLLLQLLLKLLQPPGVRHIGRLALGLPLVPLAALRLADPSIDASQDGRAPVPEVQPDGAWVRPNSSIVAWLPGRRQ